jgi:hypothetical protein
MLVLKKIQKLFTSEMAVVLYCSFVSLYLTLNSKDLKDEFKDTLKQVYPPFQGLLSIFFLNDIVK